MTGFKKLVDVIVESGGPRPEEPTEKEIARQQARLQSKPASASETAKATLQ